MRSIRILGPVVLLLVGLVAAPSAAEESSRVPAATCGGKTVTIYGTSSKEVIKGTTGDDVIHGFGGSDRIKGLGGNDTICGGYGDDIILGGRGVDFIYGGRGDDRLAGEAGGDLIAGQGGNDTLFPGTGVGGTVEGGTGHDQIWIYEEGDNDIFGGGGRDTVVFWYSPVPIKVDLSIGHYDSWGPGVLIGSLIFEVEDVTGTPYNDIIIGDIGSNVLYGGYGHDTIKGRGGDDVLLGGEGRDTLIGGGGWDRLDGGPNTDSCDGEKLKHCE